jgi:hypothetical protein
VWRDSDGLAEWPRRKLISFAVSASLSDKLAEAMLTGPRGLHTLYENLDCPLNDLHLRKACLVGTARNSTPAPV